MENYTKSTKSACALTRNMEVFFSSKSASSEAYSNESTGSSINCVTVSDTNVSVYGMHVNYSFIFLKIRKIS